MFGFRQNSKYVLFLLFFLLLDLTLFSIITFQVKTFGELTVSDQNLALLMGNLRNPFLVFVFTFITLLGEAEVIIPIVLLSSIWLYFKKRYRYSFVLSMVVLASFISAFIFKDFIARARPSYGVYILDSFAYPSAHAAVSVAFYGFMTYLTKKNFPNYKHKIAVLLIGLVLIDLIGFSRIYLGVHYLSDVLGGYALGTFWLIVGLVITERNGKPTIST